MPKLKSHPITKWLNKNCWSYHKHQIDTLEEATKGYDILLVAPTGGGKTLAGFMPAITDLIEKKYISINPSKNSPTKPYRVRNSFICVI